MKTNFASIFRALAVIALPVSANEGRTPEGSMVETVHGQLCEVRYLFGG